ncbi:hypothetical protein DQ04_01341060 [Trypanosoma grayi]|uniref:hypothetical protein n=1 Tax=Trypanosoma grayi TaxID=71804 RepID=UPI0004F455B8|nr:hypothetical protein DQ04_01341060 [Trypanosoma grayi]KEG12904.1 hypothetical protein DQ04_01341060 [Trypanosoma grayi]
MRLRAIVAFVTVLFLALLCGAPTVSAELDCGYCRSRGYSYLCSAPLSDAASCFSNSGEVRCNGGTCTCCRKTAASGCAACDEDNDDAEIIGEDI